VDYLVDLQIPAVVRGGSRMLLSDTRLTPETGIQTLGSNEMKVS